MAGDNATHMNKTKKPKATNMFIVLTGHLFNVNGLPFSSSVWLLGIQNTQKSNANTVYFEYVYFKYQSEMYFQNKGSDMNKNVTDIYGNFIQVCCQFNARAEEHCSCQQRH